MKLSRGSDEQISDEALLSGVAVGDEHCVLVFVRRYQRRLVGLARGIVSDPGVAEDVAQEAFIRILRHAAVYDVRRGAVSTWALTITRNLAIDAVRLRRTVSTAPDDVVFTRLVSPGLDVDESLARRDAASAAWAALAQLPVEQRRCVVLATIYGRTAQEISLSEGIPLGTAKGRIRLGLARLRDTVREAP
jgi:RNA polymerase sigma factor (sigma-70 family)